MGKKSTPALTEAQWHRVLRGGEGLTGLHTAAIELGEVLGSPPTFRTLAAVCMAVAAHTKDDDVLTYKDLTDLRFIAAGALTGRDAGMVCERVAGKIAAMLPPGLG